MWFVTFINKECFKFVIEHIYLIYIYIYLCVYSCVCTSMCLYIYTHISAVC